MENLQSSGEIKGPIIVELTDTENHGYRLAGNARDEDIEFQIEIVLSTGGMEEETAKFMAKKLSNAALVAREKIEKARRFEIRVVTPPKPSTLLPSQPPAKKAVSSNPKSKATSKAKTKPTKK